MPRGPKGERRPRDVRDRQGVAEQRKYHDQIVSDARLNFPSMKKTRARARYGVLENLSKPYIQRKFRRLAGIGRLGTRRPLKRPSLIAGSAAAQEALERLVARGPPGGSGISAEAWRSWHRSGFIVCPASKRPHACSNHRRRMGGVERPALQRLLADIAARLIDVVVVYKVDRLTRSLADFTAHSPQDRTAKDLH